MSAPSSAPLPVGPPLEPADLLDPLFSPNSRIFDPYRNEYVVVGDLGAGEFGRVYEVMLVSCDDSAPRSFAMKVSKSSEISYRQFEYEKQVLESMAARLSAKDMERISKIETSFMYMGHMCLVIDKCGSSLLDILVERNYRGVSLKFVQKAIRDVLLALNSLSSIGVIHCDVKPENILQYADRTERFKLIDLGSCCHEANVTETYCQSRYYRAPEVALQLEYNSKADIWSLGCVAAELMLGLPLFPALSELHLIVLIDEMLGPYPESAREDTPRQSQLFRPDGSLKDATILCRENGEDFDRFEHYFISRDLDEIIRNYVFENPDDTEGVNKEIENRRIFADLLHSMLRLDPVKRFNACQALNHPFFRIIFPE